MSPAAAAALRKVFDALEAKGCDPILTADGRGVVATCPCCGQERGLLFQVGADEPERLA